MAVTYDSTGAGTEVNATSGSWSHTIGASATALLVPIATGTNGYGPASGWTRSVSCGSTAMTALGNMDINNQSGYPFLELWGLMHPPTGAQTISMSYTNGSNTPYLVGNSISYAGVGSFDTPVINYGHSTTDSSGSVPSAVNNMVVSFHHVWANTASCTLSAPSNTSRYNYAGAQNAAPSLLIQDAAGAATNTLSCTVSATDFWDCISVNLKVPVVITPSSFFAMF